MALFPALTGMQAFQRAYNAYGPDQSNATMPVSQADSPIPHRQPDEILHAQVGPDIDTSPMSMIPSPYSNMQNMPTRLPYDENVTAQVGDDSNSEADLYEAFKQNVLNPPQRTHMTYPKSTLAGLTKALDVARTPTDYEKNRVYINGDAYQKARVYTDKTTGEKKYIQQYKQPGFMEQVMKAMPEAVSPAVDILNQPYQDQLEDWKLKNEGFKQAAAAEGTASLIRKRDADAAAGAVRAGAAATTAGARQMDAQTRAQLANLHDMTDREKADLAYQHNMSRDELKALDDYYLAMAKADREDAQIGVRGRQHMEVVQAEINARSALQKLIGTQQQANIQATGQQQRETKAAPGSSSGNSAANYPTQKKVAAATRAAEVMNDPRFQGYVSINADGFPEIAQSPQYPWQKGPTPEERQSIYNYIYGEGSTQTGPQTGTPKPPAAPPMFQGGAGNVTAPVTAPTTQQPAQPPAPINPTKPAPSKSPIAAPNTGGRGGSPVVHPPPAGAGASGGPGYVIMTTPDGKGTRNVPADKVELAKQQGFKVK